MGNCIFMVGAGGLADYVYEILAGKYRIVRKIDLEEGVPNETNLALVLNDGWDPSVHYKAEEVLRFSGIPWIRGFVSFGEGVIGPLVRPHTPGCSHCADLRRLIAGFDRKEMRELEEKLAQEGEGEHDTWATRTGLLQMALLIASETEKVLEGKRSHLEERLYLINLKTLKNSCHFFLPDPLCTVCGELPDDLPSKAQINLQPCPKGSDDSFRSRPLDDLKKVLVKDYLDERTGLMNGKMLDLVLPFADVVINMPMFIGDEGVGGRTHSYEDSEITAILEGLERYCGIEPRGKRTIVYDSYRNVKDQALNPLKVGVHAEEQYRKENFPFQPFDPNRPINWVWGYSFLQERPVLVPELLAYYSLGYGDGFVYETSNGCALGGSIEEAIFHAILEVVERDSFLMTWYAELPLPRLDLGSANDQELQLMIERVRAVAGYDLHFFNSTMEHGIPSVFAVAKNFKQEGLNLICAAAAHLDPIRAVKSAIHELAGMMLILDEKFAANRDKYKKMLYDPFLVEQMEDHGMLYGLPEAEERFVFLMADNRPMRTFADEFKPPAKSADLTVDLKDILQKFKRLNLEVIVVDQSTPITKRNGLYCVKVLIPGMLPMTFGHHLTRLTGLERVLRVPMELGFTKQPLTLDMINPHPHPFP